MAVIHTISVAMALIEDYYTILGIERTASHDEIRKAYRILALKYHPDKAQQLGLTPEQLTATFQVIQAAYETLSDPDKRKEYDQHVGISRPTPYEHEIDYEQDFQDYLNQLKTILRRHARTTNLEINKYALDDSYTAYIEELMDFLSNIDYAELSYISDSQREKVIDQLTKVRDLLNIAFVMKPGILGELTKKIPKVNLKLANLKGAHLRLGLAWQAKQKLLKAANSMSNDVYTIVDQSIPADQRLTDINIILANPIALLTMMYIQQEARDTLIYSYVRLAEEFLQAGNITTVRKVVATIDAILTDIGINFPVNEELKNRIDILKQAVEEH